MSGGVQIVIIVAVVGYVLIRRLLGEPAQGKRLLLVPAILMVLGLKDVLTAPPPPLSLAFLVGGVLLGAVFGLLRGASVRLSTKDGLVYLRYTWVTVALWVGSLALKGGLSLVEHAVAPSAGGGGGHSVLLGVGAGMLAEGVVVLLRSTGHGQMVWSTGRGGAPHATSPRLDDLRTRLAERGDARSSGNVRPERRPSRW